MHDGVVGSCIAQTGEGHVRMERLTGDFSGMHGDEACLVRAWGGRMSWRRRIGMQARPGRIGRLAHGHALHDRQAQTG
jgi:hypothetical protein